LCLYIEENYSGTFYYVHTDHLGNITAVTNANVIFRQNFDALAAEEKRKPIHTYHKTLVTRILI
jgi:hypothetical protein